MSVTSLLAGRYLRKRFARGLLVVGSIALGVATLTSSRILNRTLEIAAAEGTTPLGSGDLFISNGELGVELPLAERLREAAVPGVTAVRPVLVERLSLPGLGDRSAVFVGADFASGPLTDPNGGVTLTPTGEGPVLDLLAVQAAIQSGDARKAVEIWRRMPGHPVLISQAIQDARLAAGQRGKPLTVRYGSRAVRATPVAVVSVARGSPLEVIGRNFIGTEVVSAARLLRPAGSLAGAALAGGVVSPEATETRNPPRVNRIDVALAPGSDVAASRLRVAEVIGERATVRTPEAQGRSTQEIVEGVQIAFTLCSLAAMVVGLFLVYNALAVTVAERRPDIGVLRSLGATRPQVVALFTLLALALGLLGSLLGVPLGTAMARGVLYQFRDELGSWLVNPAIASPLPTLATVLLALLAGSATAVFAALVPAIQAATQDPADVVRRAPDPGRAWRGAHRAACLALVLGGIAMILARHQLPPRVGAFGGMMVALVGLLLAAPILVGILVRLVNPFLRRVLPVEMRLAADNLLRAPGRTGVVVGALGAGVAVMVQTAGVGRSNEEPVVRWLDNVIRAEKLVFAADLTEATSSQSPLEPGVVAELAEQPGVAGVAGFRYVRPEFNGTVIFLIALDAEVYARETAKRSPAGEPLFRPVAALAGREGCIASDNFLLKHSVKVGNAITLPGPSGPVTLTILDRVVDYSWNRGTLFMDRAVYAKLFRDPRVDLCHVYLKPGDDGAALARFAADRGLTVQDRATVRDFVAELIDRVYLLAYLQQLVVGLVAALGVVTALLISVLQRKRELGLLLAVGATPGQVIGSVLAEALLMGLFGTVLGVLIGLPMEYYVLRVVLPEESGFVFDLVVPWRQVAVVSAGAVLVSALAGLLPALSAVRTRIPEAIAYE